jgi:hypothetical protein
VPEIPHVSVKIDTASSGPIVGRRSQIPTTVNFRVQILFACIVHRRSLAPISVLCSRPKSPEKRRKAALNNVAGEDSLPKQCRSRSRAYRQRCFFASQARIWACRLASHAQARVWACKYIPGPLRGSACKYMYYVAHSVARLVSTCITWPVPCLGLQAGISRSK